jgi:hypothetical protein
MTEPLRNRVFLDGPVQSPAPQLPVDASASAASGPDSSKISPTTAVNAYAHRRGLIVPCYLDEGRAASVKGKFSARQRPDRLVVLGVGLAAALTVSLAE